MNGRTAALLLCGLFVGQALVNIWWVKTSEHVVRAPNSRAYLSELVVFDEHLRAGNPSLEQLSLSGRPPTYQLLTLPFLWMGKQADSTARYVNLPFLALLLVGIHAAGRRFGGHGVGLLAAALVSTFPPAVHLSRAYSPYYGAFCWSALGVLALVCFVSRPSGRSGWFLVATHAVGVLLHPSYLFVFGLPTLAAPVVVALARNGQSKGPSSKPQKSFRWWTPLTAWGLGPATLVCAFPVLWWYLGPGSAVLDFGNWLGSAEFVSVLGRPRVTLGHRNLPPALWYWLSLPVTLSLPMTVVAGWSILRGLVSRSLLPVFLSAFVLIGFAVLSFQVTLAWARGAMILAALALLISLSIRRLSSRRLAAWGTVGCLAIGGFNYAYVTWGAEAGVDETFLLVYRASSERPHRIFRALGLGPAVGRGEPGAKAQARIRNFEFALRLIQEDRERRDMEQAAVLLVSTLPRDRVAGADVAGLRWLKQSLLAPHLRLSHLMTVDYVLYEREPDGESRHAYHRALGEFLNAPPAAFRTHHRKLTPDQSTDVAVWARDAPWDLAEALAIQNAIDLPAERLDDPFFELLVEQARNVEE